MSDLIQREDKWHEAEHSFRLSIPCPFCSEALSSENSHHLTRCSSCSELMEWVLHEGETSLYWPRMIGDNFSSFDGHRYNHSSLFDNAELGGDQGKTSGNLEPDLAIWNVPTTQETFQLIEAWSNPGGNQEEKWADKFQFSNGVVPQSLLVMHGDLIVARNDGGITTFKDVDADWESIRREEFQSMFSDKRMHEKNFRYRPCGRFPFILISNEKECVIWKNSFGTTGSSYKKFELPSEVLEKACYMMGSPTSFYHENRLAFVMTMVAEDASNGSYICAFVQDVVDGLFTMSILYLNYRLDNPVLYSRTQDAMISLLLQGRRILKISAEILWNRSNFEKRTADTKYDFITLTKEYWFHSHLQHQYKPNPHDCMAIQSKNVDEFLVLAFESAETGQLFISSINLRALDSLTQSSWRTVEVKDHVTGTVHAMSVGSCKGQLREGQILLNTVAITLKSGIALIDMTTGQSCGEFISAADGVQGAHTDPVIISNAGIVAKIGRELRLSWDMLEWGQALGSSSDTIQLESAYMTGLTMLNDRIIVTKYSKDDENVKKVYTLEAIDIVKKNRNLRK